MGFGSFIQGAAGISDADKRNAAAQRGLLERARKAASTENFMNTNREILPFLRELQSIGAIPGFQQAAATQNARRGLTGTGLGSALSTAAGGAGELFALQQALQETGRLQSLQTGANLGFAGVNLAGPSNSNLFGQAGQNIADSILAGFGMGGGPTNTGLGPSGSVAPVSNPRGFGASPIGGGQFGF